jgi:hypothetical protein
VAGAIGIAALSTAIVLNGIRVNAARNAETATEALVRGNKDPRGACSDGAALADAGVARACATVRESDRVLQKTDDAFTVALWTGVGATAAALAWYLLAPKDRAATSARVRLQVGVSGGGAAVFGSF